MSRMHKMYNDNEKLSTTQDLEIGKEYTYMYEKVILRRIVVHYSMKEIGFWKFKRVVPDLMYTVVLEKKATNPKSMIQGSFTSSTFDHFVKHLIETYDHKNLVEEEVSKLDK